MLDDRAHGVSVDTGAALGAHHLPHAREEQPHVIIQLRGRANRRAAVLDGVLLLDGDGGRDVVDAVDVGLVHALQELPGVGAEGLHVAPLPLGVERIEHEAGLAAAAHAGNGNEQPARHVDVDVLEVVHARPPHADGAVRGMIPTAHTVPYTGYRQQSNLPSIPAAAPLRHRARAQRTATATDNG